MCQKLGVDVVCKTLGVNKMCQKLGVNVVSYSEKTVFFFRFYLLMSSSAIVWNIQSSGRQGEQK